MGTGDPTKGFCYSELFRELRLIAAGERPMPESDAKRHHYVPQLLLRKFSPRRERIWQLEKETGEIIDVRIDKAASKRRFYEFLNFDTGEKTSEMEAWLALIESHSAKALQRLEHPGPLLGLADWDRATIAFFLAMLHARTPGALEEAQRMGKTTMRLHFGSQWADPEGFAAIYAERFPDADKEELERMRVNALEHLEQDLIDYEDPAAAAMKLLVEFAGELCQMIFQSSWTVLRAEQGQFVASDLGLAMHDPEPLFPWSSQAWRSSPAAQVTIPLSSSACLLVTPGPAELARVEVDKGVVDEINLRSYGWAKRFVYGATEKEMKDLTRLAARNPQMVIEPKPKRQVMLVDAQDGDTSLADEHRRRGWPAYLYAPDPRTGVRCKHDYMVVDEDGDAIEVAARTTEMAKKRGGGPGRPEIEPVGRAA